MKKIYIIILSILLLVINGQSSYANVDATTIFNFDYDCDGNGNGVLKAVFSRSNHHIYERYYIIDTPGIISIGDEYHTTIDKNTGIKLGRCDGYKPECKISEYTNWEYEKDLDKDYLSINFESVIDIDGVAGDNKVDFKVQQSGTGTQNTTHQLNLKTFGETTQEIKDIGKEASVKLDDSSLIITGENGTEILKIDLKRTSGINDEYYLNTDLDNNRVVLMKKIYKRVGTGTTNNDTTPKTFNAYRGQNIETDKKSGCILDSNLQKANTGETGRCTMTKNWMSGVITTTDVVVHPENFSCTEEIYNDNSIGGTVNYEYSGNLGDVKQPTFDGPVIINGYTGNEDGIIIAATGSLDISGLSYTQVGEIEGDKMAVDSINITIREGITTIGEYRHYLSPAKDTIGSFDKIQNVKLKANNNVTDDFDIISKREGNYILTFTFYEEKQILGTYDTPLLILPNNELKAKNTTVIGDNKYANGEDKIQVCSEIEDSFQNKIERTENYNLLPNIVGNLGGEGFIVENVVIQKTSKLCFDIVAIKPGKVDKTTTIKIPKHQIDIGMKPDGGYTDEIKIVLLPEIEFKNALKGYIEIKDPDNNNWKGKPLSAIDQVYRIKLENPGGLTSIDGQFNPETNKRNVTLDTKGQFWAKFNNMDNTFKIVGGKVIEGMGTFLGRIDADTLENLKEESVVQVKGLNVEYTIKGRLVNYPLEDFSITGCEQKLLGVLINGITQLGGKITELGKDDNFSDISSSQMRNIIRQNSYKLVQNSPRNQVINGVKIVENKDETIKGDQDYETLIVINGNVIISGDLNPSKKPLGIIVLKDGYQVNKDFNTQGNVYVNNNIGTINAVIYADGAFRSAKANGDSYNDSDLGKQLIVNGSLFTRNTVGGAVLGTHQGDDYLLPGGQKTGDVDLAKKYDLNEIRKWLSSKCTGEDYIFYVNYDSKIQISPPKGFTIEE